MHALAALRARRADRRAYRDAMLGGLPARDRSRGLATALLLRK